MAAICSDESFDECWAATDSARDVVRVGRVAFHDVLLCARDSGQAEPAGLIPNPSRRPVKYLEVDRKLLFDFMHEHSCVCHAKERTARKKETSRAP